MIIDLKSATPWPEIVSRVKNARSLIVIADGKKYDGAADLSIDEFGTVTLEVGKKPRKDKK